MLRIVVLLSVVAVVMFGIDLGITRQSAVAQEATPGAEAAEMAEVLVVQSFAAGRLDPAGEPGRATLMLEPPVGDAVYFGNRPNRFAGTVSTADLLQALAESDGDTPNAALVVPTGDDGELVVVVDLLQGEADAAGAVTFDVQLVGGFDELDLAVEGVPLTELTEPLQFGAGHLFIDPVYFCRDLPCVAG